MEKITLNVKELSVPTTVKEYLLSAGFSITLIKSVKYGGIYLNGNQVTVRAKVTNNDTLEVYLPYEKSEGIEPIDIPIKIIFEDEYIVVADKPRNMPTHPSRGNSLPTLANAIMARYGGDFVFRAVNRLDRDTSGLVIIAKDRISAYRLSEAMKTGKFKKKYKALLKGIPYPRNGIIDAPIRREAEGSIKRGVFADGKRAITEYKVIKEKDENALCEIILHTGRTHQIRVHMAHIGHPLYGDFLYGTRSESDYFLRCEEIEFEHPITGEILKICAPSESIM